MKIIANRNGTVSIEADVNGYPVATFANTAGETVATQRFLTEDAATDAAFEWFTILASA